MPVDFLTRFAPSPTGPLHLGHAYAAWFVAEQAKKAGGSWLLRIEDLDWTRCRPEFETSLLEDMSWLGLRGSGSILRQSTRLEAYAQALEQLKARGLVYPCVCTRQQVLAESPGMGPDGPIYAGRCRHIRPQLTESKPAWRLNIAAALKTLREPLAYEEVGVGMQRAHPERFGDCVLGRRDLGTSYHLAVVLDDAMQGISQVIRGEDLRAATDLHVLLQALLDLPQPKYAFHRLVADHTGRAKLSKRKGAQSLANLRAQGLSPADLIRLAQDRLI